MKVDFVVQAYVSSTAASAVKSKSKKGIENPSSSSNSKIIGPTEIEVQNVLDVLPHLEVSFIRKLLVRYDNTESAIAAVLEGNLPPDLVQTDSQITESIADEGIKKCSKLMEKTTLDPEGREIIKIKSQVIRPKAEKRFLDDKSAIKEFHMRNIEHGYVDMVDEYDDEYDDSYEAVVESESKTMKILKNTGAINDLVDEVGDSDESESSDEVTTEGAEHRDRNRDFCENPELIRERWARNRVAKYGNTRPARPSGCVNSYFFTRLSRI